MDSRALLLTVVVALLSGVVGLFMHNKEAEELATRRAQAKRELGRAEQMLATSEAGRTTALQKVKELQEESDEVDRLRKKTADDLVAARSELKALEKVRNDLLSEKASLANRFAAARQQVIAKEAARKYPRLVLLGGKVLLDAQVQKVTPTAITFKHSLGMTSATVAELPTEFVDRFLIVEASPVTPSSAPRSQVEEAADLVKEVLGDPPQIVAIKRKSAEIHRLDQRIASTHAEIPRLDSQIKEARDRRAPNPALVNELVSRQATLKGSIDNLMVRRTAMVQVLLSEIESTRIKLGQDPKTLGAYSQFLDREFYLWDQRLREIRY